MRGAGCLCLLVAGCSAGPLIPSLGTPEIVVPGSGLPPQVTSQDSNNNLDVVRHDGRVFLAFRTGPSHFAHTDVQMYVVSSTDQKNWRFETNIALGTDVREPRFLSWQGKLHLYFAVLGSNPLDFEPGDSRRITRLGDGTWTGTTSVYEPGFIPWRVKIVRDRPHMIGYIGGEAIYNFEEGNIDVHWLKSDDGDNWTPAQGSNAIVSSGGGSEADYAIVDDDVYAVIRNELGDATGHGSKICKNWKCESDPKKYDSPLVFKHEDEVLLVGRRTMNQTYGGRYDLGLDDLSLADETSEYLFTYSGDPKRCALWQVDKETLKVSRLTDLPSQGDTCFASVLSNEDGSYTIYNYTSPLDGPDLSWFRAQLETTQIYRIHLTFE